MPSKQHILFSHTSSRTVIRRLTAIVLCLAATVSIERAWALSELFELYTPPQAAGMGMALAADATGYLANYYNPAGLAKTPRQRTELNLVDVEGNFGTSGVAALIDAKSFGRNNLFGAMASHPNSYTYFSFSSVPSISVRNFSLSILSNYRYAAQSDGSNIDIDSVADLGPVVGFSSNFFGNILKVGVSEKALIRNQLKGNYPLSAFPNEDATNSLASEGFGFSTTIGMLLTLPNKWLPAFGLVWKDALNTHFTAAHIFNSKATGAPADIAQSVDMAFSVHPFLAKKFWGTFAVQVRHLEANDIPLTKRISFGIQLESEKSMYYWFGLNALMDPCFGVALRLPGGNLELSTYAEDVGAGSVRQADRRVMFRYTIGF